MTCKGTSAPARFRAITTANVRALPQWDKLDEGVREAVNVVSAVLTKLQVVDRAAAIAIAREAGLT